MSRSKGPWGEEGEKKLKAYFTFYIILGSMREHPLKKKVLKYHTNAGSKIIH